jgi:hypothetical protein
MGRKPKLYVPLTVTFFEDDRIIDVGDGPTLLYLAMCLHCKACGSDGRITETQVARLHRPRWKVELRRLAEVGLVVFDDTEQDWFIAGWLSHNESVASVHARLAADRDRKSKISDRNPDGFHGISGLKGREGKERKGSNPGGNLHRYVDSGDGACSECSLPSMNSVHLRSVEAS